MKILHQRHLLPGLLLLSLLPLTASADEHATHPNILVIYADDLGFGDLTCYNPDSKIPTPSLDALAAAGTRFTDGHSSSGICTPSRYALLTGRHHWRKFHGIVGALGGSVFKPERLTVPEMLKEKGYTTGCIGKWHLGWDWNAIRKPTPPPAEKPAAADAKKPAPGKKRPPKKSIHFDAFDWSKSIPDGPLAHGFDTYFGDTVINFPPYAWIIDDKLQKAPDAMMDTAKWKPIKEGRWECRPGPMASDWDPYENIPETTRRGEAWIKQQADTDGPFFLYFAYPSPHAPIIPNDEFDGKSQAGPYGDFVYETDASVGRLLKALADSGQAENTLVVFTADNGPEKYAYARDEKFDHWSAEPLRGLKRDIYEGGHRVPFIVRWPGKVAADATSHQLVSQIDLMATFASIVHYDLPAENAAEDSHDLLPLLTGKTDTSPRTAHVHNTYSSAWAFRHGDYLLIVGKNGYHSGHNKGWESRRDLPPDNDAPVELYNLAKDIGQTNDLAPDRPEKVKELQTAMATIRKQGFSAPRLSEK